jgi:hypothetical protein
MTELPNPPRRWLGLPVMVWVAMILATAAESACYAFVGQNLGLLIGGLVFAALLVPPLSLAEDRLLDRLLVAGSVNDGIAIVWLVAVFTSPITFEQWVLCYAVLIAWCFALVGIASLIRSLEFARREYTPGSPRCNHRGLNGDSIPASAIVVLLALLWISSPVWLATVLPTCPTLNAWIVRLHPLMAMNGTLRNMGLWSERPIAYRYLLTLGQDVPYELPGVTPMVVFHCLICAAGLALSRVLGRR